MSKKHDFKGMAKELKGWDGDILSQTEIVNDNLKTIQYALRLADRLQSDLISPEMCDVGKNKWNEIEKQGCAFKVSFCHHIFKAMTTKLMEEIGDE